MEINVTDQALREAASKGCDEFLSLVVGEIARAAGGELNESSLGLLNSEQITLWGYIILRDELMDGGFVQLIHNGYGPFFFDNPFAKAMRMWDLRDFSKLIYKARKLYLNTREELTKECTEEEFMALFERFPEFDELDDEFVENEEAITNAIAHYVDGHLENFVTIK